MLRDAARGDFARRPGKISRPKKSANFRTQNFRNSVFGKKMCHGKKNRSKSSQIQDLLQLKISSTKTRRNWQILGTNKSYKKATKNVKTTKAEDDPKPNPHAPVRFWKRTTKACLGSGRGAFRAGRTRGVNSAAAGWPVTGQDGQDAPRAPARFSSSPWPFWN
jgi:hypothetical protein